MQEDIKITAAAIQHNGKVYEGRRHAEIMCRIWDEDAEAGREPSKIRQEVQGFVASDGQFYNRFQAGAIAYRAGQTKVRHEYLLSEYVW